MLKLHKRRDIVQKARGEFETFLLELEQKHALSYGEMFSLLGSAVANLTKYQIRAERHPDDPEKKGDEA